MGSCSIGMSFYQSISEVQGAGAVARGHQLAILALPGFLGARIGLTKPHGKSALSERACSSSSMVPIAAGDQPTPWMVMAALFICPALAGVSEAAIRLIFDLRYGSITTGVLAIIAGGVAALLFITAQMAAGMGTGVLPQQAARLVPFCFLIGFTAGIALLAVFWKLIASDVVETRSIQVRNITR